MLRVGLTGGIASGKSTIAGFFEEFGALTLDGDLLAHEVMNAGGCAHDEVVAAFGEEIVLPDGRIDRPALGARVFADPEALSRLNAIVHPRVHEELKRRIEAYVAGGGESTIAVFHAALIVESGGYRNMDRLIVAFCSRETQVARVMQRGLSEAEALARIAAQSSNETKLALADYSINTEASLEQTRKAAREIHRRLLDRAG
ncbi:hypothetical protein ABI59_10380 [Acidobacteria bacterium Mor1]|nr:hypothetical protein ABI59_10380 [Acidobacteria bacterium Mor1]